jgi:succinate dehydrogenase/fumarate reductase flavoprotein subunit
VSERYDVAVVGGGLAGVSAALRAAEAGAFVVLLEAGDELGGTALHSGGGIHVWGAQTWEEYLAHCPFAPERPARALVENYGRYVEWLRAIGAPGSFSVATTNDYTMGKYDLGKWFVSGPKLRWFGFVRRRLEELGTTVHTASRVTALARGDDCFIVSTGGQNLRARAVVLAAGGFQANPGLLAEHTGTDPSVFVARAVQYNVGDGLRLAESLGAAQTESMDTLYGHLMPAPPCRISWSNYLDPALLSAFYAQHSVILNLNGERFVDEGKGELNGETINACVRQPAGGLWIVFDDAVRRSQLKRPFDHFLDRVSLRSAWLLRFVRLRKDDGRIDAFFDLLAFARARGAVVLESRTLDNLGRQLSTHGVDGKHAVETIREFNAGPQQVALPKTVDAKPLETPPFYAIKVAVGVSMTYGGVAIDERTRALDAHGDPVPGLFAAPGTAGGIHWLHYGGALAACGVFGMIAGEEAAAAALAVRATAATLSG